MAGSNLLYKSVCGSVVGRVVFSARVLLRNREEAPAGLLPLIYLFVAYESALTLSVWRAAAL